MQVPSAAELLAVWERAQFQPITARALMLLEAASPGESKADLARLSVGQRDARLLALRELLFGSQMTGLMSCPRCRQQLEIDFECVDIKVERDQPDQLLSTSSGGYVARFRLPNSNDLDAVAESEHCRSDEAATVRELLSRCVIELRRNGRKQKTGSARAWPPALIDAIAAEMERADPQANVQLHLNCVDCGHRWWTTFDIVPFLWTEIDNGPALLRGTRWPWLSGGAKTTS
jgi:hypothetical protein